MNEIRHKCYCVVVCCCVRTYGTWCLVFGDTLFSTLDLKVCVCVCVCLCVCVPARPAGDHMPAPDPTHRLAADVRARILAAIP